MTSPRFDLDAGSFVLSLAVADDGRLHQVGLGAEAPPADLPFPVGLYPLALPTFGEEVQREPALRVTHADGALSTRLRFAQSEVGPAPDRPDVPAVGIGLVDRVAPVTVDLWFRPWPDLGLLESWVVVANAGDAPITVHDAAATSWSFAGSAPTFTHWGGGWAGEWAETTEALGAGVKTVASFGGVRSSLYRPPVVLFAPDGPASEHEGTVAACTLLWGGDTRFDAEVALHGQQRLIAGHQGRGAERVLDAGESFETPHALWCWSDRGIAPTSHAFHRFAREHVLRDGDRIRSTVINTWEAVGFEIDPVTLGEQISEASMIGGEVFLLDDGWFGTEYPRDDDTQGLGDWETDRNKFPNGLQPIIDATLAEGLRFGLWVEPEMVNPRSVLFRDHPDWVIGEPGREAREERQQLVLDLTRPAVRDFCIDTIDRILADHDGISYLKWDANRDVTEPGSMSLADDRQSHLAIDRVRATWTVMAEIARRHPDVELMLCASGGGRSDLGTLGFFHELWTSDNTDPIDRLRIQWGASHLLPASVLGAHVTRWGERPVPFGCAVAMSGRFGLDLDLTRLNDHERLTCRQATEDYAAIRDVVQFGDLHRLVSPLGDSDRAALAYVAPDGERAVVFAYLLPADRKAPLPGPDEAIEVPPPPAGRTWGVVDRTPGREPGTGRVVAGLANNRLDWPDGRLRARVVELVAR